MCHFEIVTDKLTLGNTLCAIVAPRDQTGPVYSLPNCTVNRSKYFPIFTPEILCFSLAHLHFGDDPTDEKTDKLIMIPLIQGKACGTYPIKLLLTFLVCFISMQYNNTNSRRIYKKI